MVVGFAGAVDKGDFLEIARGEAEGSAVGTRARGRRRPRRGAERERTATRSCRPHRPAPPGRVRSALTSRHRARACGIRGHACR